MIVKTKAEFEILPAQYNDLAPGDPMRPATIVHALGAGAEACYEAVGRQYSIYVVGRGPLSPTIGPGYFFTAAHVDYSTLRAALRPFWPDMPASPPARKLGDIPRLITSQEFADVVNYTSRPPEPDARIFNEARTRMPTEMSRSLQAPFARVCRWLRTHMLPANNCYALAALLARWFQVQDVQAEFCTGELAFKPAGREIVVSHAWVEVAGQVLDLTVDKQDAWGNDQTLRKTARIGVQDRRLSCSRADGRDAQEELANLWQRYSKPESRFGYSYTPASQERQAAMIREKLQSLPEKSDLRHERAAWTALVVQYGVIEGTFRLLEMVGQDLVLNVEEGQKAYF
ncbi:MAG TPA: hypothetical protein PKO09_01650 [Anaerolineae bacterium]|nr:hypothetical protein [Anaerolineae bacterium]